jgi:hypothetical protein
MSWPVKIRHEFVEFIPKDREEGVLYVSIPYATAVHNCFCGCGSKVVTPISPVGWQISFDGETVSLTPSVGNWAFACRSHYVVKRNVAVWAGNASDAEVARGRRRDKAAREAYFDGKIIVPADVPAPQAPAPRPSVAPDRKRGFWAWLIGGARK